MYTLVFLQAAEKGLDLLFFLVIFFPLTCMKFTVCSLLIFFGGGDPKLLASIDLFRVCLSFLITLIDVIPARLDVYSFIMSIFWFLLISNIDETFKEKIVKTYRSKLVFVNAPIIIFNKRILTLWSIKPCFHCIFSIKLI